MIRNVLFTALFLFCGSAVLAQVNFSSNPMVRENNTVVYVDTMRMTSDPYIILTNYNNEEILVVVQDLLGNEIYSKVVFKNQHAVLKALDPYNKIPSGVYTVVATNRNEIYNQRIVVD